VTFEVNAAKLKPPKARAIFETAGEGG